MVDFVFGEKKYPPHIHMQDAEELLRGGLKWFAGDNYVWYDEYNEIVKWLTDNDKKGLFLSGRNGTGKSLIATKIIPAIFNKRFNINTYIAPSIYLSSIFSDKGEYMSMVCSRIIVLDDIGAESIVNDYGTKRDLFSELVDIAEIESRLLIITTNMIGDDIKERYGLRTYDRLRPYKHVVINEESLRK